MYRFKYLLGVLLGAIIGTLVLRELYIFPGMSVTAMTTSHTATLIHSIIIFLGFIVAGLGGAAWLNLHEVSTAYQRKINDLKEINRLKNDLLSAASHEIRSPLTSILWGVREIVDSTSPPISDQHRKMLQQIHDAIFLLRGTANDFLNLARLENNSIEITLKTVPISNIAEALETIVNESRIRARMVGIEIATEIALTSSHFVAADMHRVAEVATNLIENAVNYTKSGGTILLRAGIEHDKLIISVKDDGIGIPDADKPKIFTKLFRALNARRAQSTGTGLGLYLSKKFIEAQNGTIWFESKEGSGTVFAFSLPLHRGAPIEEFFKKM